MLADLRPAAALLALLAASLLVLACGEDRAVEPPADFVPPALPESGIGGAYLALGDAIAAGIGASEPAGTGYVALVAQAMRARFGETLEFQSLAAPGDTTQALVDRQLGPALDRILSGDVRLVTLTIGADDLSVYMADPACLPDPSDPACPLENGLLAVERRLDRTLQDLREAAPEAAIVIQVYPNFYSGSAHELEWTVEIALDRLNGVVIGVAQRYGVLVADPRAPFEGHSEDLTHLADPASDFHPNDAGHGAIAEAFLEVLGLATTDGATD